MKYFTPELLKAGNSEDSGLYNNFDEIWEQKLELYRKYLDLVSKQIPPSVGELARRMCLHDGKIVRRTKHEILVELGQIVYSITFVPHTHSFFSRISKTPPRDRYDGLWLYDELEIIAPGVFQFEILTSTYEVLRYRFKDVLITKSKSRQSARTDFAAKLSRSKARKSRSKSGPAWVYVPDQKTKNAKGNSEVTLKTKNVLNLT
jgi:hypothetical protein